MHNFIVVDSHGCYEGDFLVVVRVHRNLVVSEENIHEAHQLVSYCCPLACRCKVEERDPLDRTYWEWWSLCKIAIFHFFTNYYVVQPFRVLQISYKPHNLVDSSLCRWVMVSCSGENFLFSTSRAGVEN